MVSRWTIVNEAKGMANRHTGVDADGVYSMQCVDLPNYMSRKYFGKSIWGNGNDGMRAAAGNGYKTFTSGRPMAGDFFVANVAGSAYGHTGLVIEDYKGSGPLKCIEQNFNTNGSGGPCVYVNRSFPSYYGTTIFGWWRPPYSDAGKSSTSSAKPLDEDKHGVKFRNITYGGHTLSSSNLNILAKYLVDRSILPSGAISQLYLESNFGDSAVGRNDNNWSGMSGGAQTRPSGVKVTTGMSRPASEGGTYMHYANITDFFNDWTYLLAYGSYRVAGRQNISDYTKGLFRAGGAGYDYAAIGYNSYNSTMNSVRAGINNTNGHILDELDEAWKKGYLIKGMGANKKKVEWEDTEVNFLFKVKEDSAYDPDTVHYYNGAINEIQPVHNPEEMKYLRQVYKECVGRELKYYTWNKKSPVYLRVFGTLKPGSQNQAILDKLKELEKELDAAVD